MTPQSRMRRIGWFGLLTVCTALYGVLHFQVWSLSSDVTKAERQIVRLEEGNLLLETEFLTRSSQMQLTSWNRIDFGYAAPNAGQFIDNERQLARFGSPRDANAPEAIRLASASVEDGAASFPSLVSPLTGRPVDVSLVVPDRGSASSGRTPLIVSLAERTIGAPIAASAGGSSPPTTVRVSLTGAGQ